jgi:hypothetical protein
MRSAFGLLDSNFGWIVKNSSLVALRVKELCDFDSYLVDPASSHMLVSKIKPCMSKYKQIYTVKLRMAH